MAKSNSELVQRYRDRQRTKGLRPVQVWLPDTRTAAFAAQVAHDIAAVADLAPEDAAMLDAFEGITAEDWRECG